MMSISFFLDSSSVLAMSSYTDAYGYMKDPNDLDQSLGNVPYPLSEYIFWSVYFVF